MWAIIMSVPVWDLLRREKGGGCFVVPDLDCAYTPDPSSILVRQENSGYHFRPVDSQLPLGFARIPRDWLCPSSLSSGTFSQTHGDPHPGSMEAKSLSFGRRRLMPVPCQVSGMCRMAWLAHYSGRPALVSEKLSCTIVLHDNAGYAVE